MTPASIRTIANPAHIARVIAERRRLCVGEGFRVVTDTRNERTPA